MKIPTMIIVFDTEMAGRLKCGMKCAFAAHAALNNAILKLKKLNLTEERAFK